MKNRRKGLILSLLVLGIMLITTGVTYAIFKYGQLGNTTNTITVGGIVFHYNEQTNKGRGISLTDTLPISDSEGKELTSYFDFEITSKTQSEIEVPYTVTAKISSDSTLNPNIVKLYVSDQNELEIESPKYFTEPYNSTGKTWLQAYNGNQDERIVYQGTVPENSSNYNKDFRVRIWLDENTNFAKQCTNPEYITESACIAAGEEWTYLYNDKTFSITFNVYATGSHKEIPTIPTCPGCQFVYTTDTLTIGTSTLPENVTDDYTTLQYYAPTEIYVTSNNEEEFYDYNSCMNANNPGSCLSTYGRSEQLSQRPYFLGLIANSDTGVIERIFVCGIVNLSLDSSVPFCLEGVDTTKYADPNVTTLNTLFSGCSTNQDNITCFFNGSLYAAATSAGLVGVGAMGDTGNGCLPDIDNNNNYYCHDELPQCKVMDRYGIPCL